MQKSLKRNVILNVLKTVAGLAFPLITFPYVSNILGPENIGKVNYANSIMSSFLVIAMLGINAYGMREGAKVRDDAQKFNQLVKELFIINILAAFAAYIVFFAVLFFVQRLVAYRQLMLLMSISILFTVLGMEWVYNALEEYAYITVRSLLFQVASLALLFLLVRERGDYMAYAFVIVVSSVGSNILNFVHLRGKVSFKMCEPAKLKKHLRPILTLFAMTVAISLYTILDTMMLGFLRGDLQTGIYTAAVRLTRIIISLITSVGFVLRPRASHYVEKDTDAFRRLVTATSDIYQMLCIPAVMGLFILAEPIILLFCGNAFRDSVGVMRIISPIILFISFGQFFSDQIFIPLRKDAYSFYPVVLAAVINICMNAVLIPRFGAFGAAAATVAAEGTVCVMKLLLCRRVFAGVGGLFSHLWQYVLASAVMSGLLMMVFRSFTVMSVPVLIEAVCFGMAVYALVLFALRNECFMKILSAIASRLGGKKYGN